MRLGNPEERRNRLPQFGSGDLKHPSFPPVAMGSSVSGLVDRLQSPTARLLPLISIVPGADNSFQRKSKLLR